jgi:hypothetical protein
MWSVGGRFDVWPRKIRVEEKQGKMVANKIKKNHIREVVCVYIRYIIFRPLSSYKSDAVESVNM